MSFIISKIKVLIRFCMATYMACTKKCPDLSFRIARMWSNKELAKFAHIFKGVVVNVSAGTDQDKEGKLYKDYFINAEKYFITNYFTRKTQQKDSIFLDLEKKLPVELKSCADVVFNHTTLEHVYNFQLAFESLSLMTKDVLIVVVPFMQQMHGLNFYNDYWRFTPEAMCKMYKENGFKFRYCAANINVFSSKYLFCIGYKDKKWSEIIPFREDGIMQDRIIDNNINELLGADIFSKSFFIKAEYFFNKLK